MLCCTHSQPRSGPARRSWAVHAVHPNRPKNSSPPNPQSVSTRPISKPRKESMLVDELNAWRHASKKVKIMDEYEEYLSTLPLEAGTVINLVIWWGHHRGQWPNLSRLAFDALSIPATLAECERSFSDPQRTITDERANLAPKAIEACSYVKNWLKRNCDTKEIPGIGPDREGGEPEVATTASASASRRRANRMLEQHRIASRPRTRCDADAARAVVIRHQGSCPFQLIL